MRYPCQTNQRAMLEAPTRGNPSRRCPKLQAQSVICQCIARLSPQSHIVNRTSSIAHAPGCGGLLPVSWHRQGPPSCVGACTLNWRLVTCNSSWNDLLPFIVTVHGERENRWVRFRHQVLRQMTQHKTVDHTSTRLQSRRACRHNVARQRVSGTRYQWTPHAGGSCFSRTISAHRRNWLTRARSQATNSLPKLTPIYPMPSMPERKHTEARSRWAFPANHATILRCEVRRDLAHRATLLHGGPGSQRCL